MTTTGVGAAGGATTKSLLRLARGSSVLAFLVVLVVSWRPVVGFGLHSSSIPSTLSFCPRNQRLQTLNEDRSRGKPICWLEGGGSSKSDVGAAGGNKKKKLSKTSPLRVVADDFTAASSTDEDASEQFAITTEPRGRRKYSGTTRRRKNKSTTIGNVRKRTERIMRLTSPNEDQRMLEQPHPDPNFVIAKSTFNNLINYWAHAASKRPGEATDRVEALVRRMEVIHDYQRKGRAAAGNNEGVVEYARIVDADLAPDVRSYTMAIQCLAKSGRRDAGKKAEAILNKMKDLVSSKKNPAAAPNMYTYTAVMEALVASRQKDAAPRSQKLLEELLDLYESSGYNLSYRPNTRTFNAAITAWARHWQLGAAMMAERCLDRMESLYQSGRDSTDALLAGRYDAVRPNRINFNSVIHAWANSGEENAPQHAEEILERMQRLYEETGDPDVKPDVKSYNQVIDAWAKSEQEGAAQRAEEILGHMEKLYDTGLGDVDVKPNIRSFNSVLNAWAKSAEDDAAENAEDLLTKMTQRYEETGDYDIKPDVHSFSTVINAWGRSFSFGKADRAQGILRHITDLYENGNRSVRPNVVIFNSVMNACAFCVGDDLDHRRAMEIAHETYKEMERSEYCTPDQVTYGTFLKVCANQMPAGEARQAVAEAVFKKCCKDGQVGDLVLSEMTALATPEQYAKLVGGRQGTGDDGGDAITVKDLPREWRCNVQERRTHSYAKTHRRQLEAGGGGQ